MDEWGQYQQTCWERGGSSAFSSRRALSRCWSRKQEMEQSFPLQRWTVLSWSRPYSRHSILSSSFSKTTRSRLFLPWRREEAEYLVKRCIMRITSLMWEMFLKCSISTRKPLLDNSSCWICLQYSQSCSYRSFSSTITSFSSVNFCFISRALKKQGTVKNPGMSLPEQCLETQKQRGGASPSICSHTHRMASVSLALALLPSPGRSFSLTKMAIELHYWMWRSSRASSKQMSLGSMRLSRIFWQCSYTPASSIRMRPHIIGLLLGVSAKAIFLRRTSFRASFSDCMYFELIVFSKSCISCCSWCLSLFRKGLMLSCIRWIFSSSVSTFKSSAMLTGLRFSLLSWTVLDSLNLELRALTMSSMSFPALSSFMRLRSGEISGSSMSKEQNFRLLLLVFSEMQNLRSFPSTGFWALRESTQELKFLRERMFSSLILVGAWAIWSGWTCLKNSASLDRSLKVLEQFFGEAVQKSRRRREGRIAFMAYDN